MNRGNDQRYVPHVGRGGETRELGGRWEKAPAQRLGIAAIRRGDGSIVHDVGVRGARLFDAQRAAGGERTRLETAVKACSQSVDIGQCPGPGSPAAGGVRRDDIRCFPAAGDDAVDALIGLEMLAEEADRRLRDDEGIAGVHAAIGKGGGVGGLAMIVHIEIGIGEHRGLEHVEGRGMHHHRGVHAGERATFEQANLAAAGLLRRRADDVNGETDLIGQGCCCQPCTCRHGGNHVVAAGVAYGRQRVVLGADGDVDGPVACAGDERSWQVEGSPGDAQALAVQELAQPGRCPMLFEGQLGMGVNAMAQRDEGLGPLGQVLPGRGLRVHGERASLACAAAVKSPPGAEAPCPAERGCGIGGAAMFGLRLSAEDEAFRAELRRWLAEHLPREPPPEGEVEHREWQRRWQRTLAEGGWVGIHWPRAHGGRGATLEQQVLFTEEMARVGAPEILDPVAVNIVASVVMQAGTPEQQRRWLPRILRADEVWCLGFSEPGAGSDLAALRTRAVRQGDHWVVSGQKVWSSKAHFADWLLLLARTDPEAPRHRGITCLAVPMRSPGITWRPLVQIDGRREFNEVFLDEVRVPVQWTIGPVHGGWPLIRAALAHERGTLWAFDFKIRLQNGARALVDLYRRVRAGGPGRGSGLEALRQQVTQAWIESEVFAAHTMRILPRLHAGAGTGADAALQKVLGSELQQRACELEMALLAQYGQVMEGPRAVERGAIQGRFLYSRSVTISSGTSEVLRSLIAQQALGLPRA